MYNGMWMVDRGKVGLGYDIDMYWYEIVVV